MLKFNNYKKAKLKKFNPLKFLSQIKVKKIRKFKNPKTKFHKKFFLAKTNLEGPKIGCSKKKNFFAK